MKKNDDSNPAPKLTDPLGVDPPTQGSTKQAIQCIREDLDMLADGSWQPDDDSIDATRAMLIHIEKRIALLEKS